MTWKKIEIIILSEIGTEKQGLHDLTHLESNKVNVLEMQSRMVVTWGLGKEVEAGMGKGWWSVGSWLLLGRSEKFWCAFA
jgi:hypothetical protein